MDRAYPPPLKQASVSDSWPVFQGGFLGYVHNIINRDVDGHYPVTSVVVSSLDSK